MKRAADDDDVWTCSATASCAALFAKKKLKKADSGTRTKKEDEGKTWAGKGWRRGEASRKLQVLPFNQAEPRTFGLCAPFALSTSIYLYC